MHVCLCRGHVGVTHFASVHAVAPCMQVLQGGPLDHGGCFCAAAATQPVKFCHGVHCVLPCQVQVYQGVFQGHLAGHAVLSFVASAQCHPGTMGVAAFTSCPSGWAATWCPSLYSLTCCAGPHLRAWVWACSRLSCLTGCLTQPAGGWAFVALLQSAVLHGLAYGPVSPQVVGVGEAC